VASVTTVVLADDHWIVRTGLRAVFGATPDLNVVGEAVDGLDAVRLCAELRPDVLLVDLTMPGLSGLEVTRQVVRRALGARVVVQSMHASEEYVLEAFRQGALGYVLKGSEARDVVQAVRAVAAGRRYLSPALAERAIEAYALEARKPRDDPYDKLTTREREVLQLTSEGLTLAEIGRRLSTSPRTAETHRANMMRKLGLRTQSDLIQYAIRRGLLPREAPRPSAG
jgi:DNA-binding NarL/FixJ family response regulator